jgi:hypothetical protein
MRDANANAVEMEGDGKDVAFVFGWAWLALYELYCNAMGRTGEDW